MSKKNDSKKIEAAKKRQDRQAKKKALHAKKAAKNQKQLFRLPALIFGFGIIAIVIVFALFFLNPLFLSLTRKTLSGLAGAPISLKGGGINITDTSVRYLGFGWTDKNDTTKNIFSFDSANFAMDTAALLRKKAYIREMSIRGLRFGSPSGLKAGLTYQKNASVTKGRVPKNDNKDLLTMLDIKLPKFSKEDMLKFIQNELAPLQAQGDAIKEKYISLAARYQKEIESIGNTKEAERLIKEAKALNLASLTKLEDIPKLQAAFQKLQQAKTILENTQQQVFSLKSTFDADAKLLQADLEKSISLVSNTSIGKMLRQGALPDVKELAAGIIGMDRVVLVDSVITNYNKYKGLISLLNTAPKKPSATKLKTNRNPYNQIIHFPGTRAPVFGIENMHADGIILQDISFSATVQDIFQGLPKPVKLQLTGKKAAAKIEIQGSFVSSQQAEPNRFTANATGLTLSNFFDLSIPGSPLVDATASMQLNLEDAKDTLHINGTIFLDTLVWNSNSIPGFSGLPELARNLFADILQEVKNISLGFDVRSQKDSTQTEITSNIESTIQTVLSKLVEKELAAATKQGEVLLKTKQADLLQELRKSSSPLAQYEKVITAHTVNLQAGKSDTDSIQRKINSTIDDIKKRAAGSLQDLLPTKIFP